MHVCSVVWRLLFPICIENLKTHTLNGTSRALQKRVAVFGHTRFAVVFAETTLRQSKCFRNSSKFKRPDLGVYPVYKRPLFAAFLYVLIKLDFEYIVVHIRQNR